MELSEDLIRSRGDNFILIQHHYHYDLRKFNFTNCVNAIWNSLSNYVSANIMHFTFKGRLDKIWSNQKYRKYSIIIIKQISMVLVTVVAYSRSTIM